MTTPASSPVVHPTRRARRIAEAAESAGRDVPAGPVPSLPADRRACPEPAALPTRRSLRDDRTRARRRRLLPLAPARPDRAVRRTGRAPLGRGRASIVTATALVATLVVGVSSPQVAVAGTPSRQGDRAVGTTAAQDLAPSGVDPEFDGRDAYSVAETARGDRTVVGGTVVSGAVRPVDGTVPVAGGFGGRHVAGCSACSTDHHGLDFAAATGTPVHAVLPGVVVSAGAEGGYGLAVVVRHADGLATRYAHLSRVDARVGQTVAAGTVLGRVGSTGVSTGSHLHFEVLVHGVATDPAPWLRARGLL